MMIYRRPIIAASLVLAGLFLNARSANALVSYYAEYMTSWSGCDTSQSGLSYTDDQVNQFAGAMDSSGLPRIALWANGNVWASDITDNANGGADSFNADAAELYVLSSHGINNPDSSGLQSYQTPMCHPGASLSSPWFEGSFARWGGGAGGGTLRWAVLLTCFSVDSSPNLQWDNAFNGTQFEYIMGYRGLSADSTTTAEVARDWANSAIISTTANKFKASWFTATSDWFVNDTAEVMSGGADLASANNRRDNLTRVTTHRVAGQSWPVFAWSWQQG
jgi:hypothetical protein